MSGIRNKIEKFFEDIEDARIANRRYVTNHAPSLLYKDLKKPLVYGITMRNVTRINEEELKNEYAQNLTVDFNSKDYENNYWFSCKIKSKAFKLDKALIGQETLVKQLNSLTESIEVGVAHNGFIRSASHEKVIEKWTLVKQKLLKNYNSKQAIDYIGDLEVKINNYNLYLEDLKQPHYLGLLFGGYQQLEEQSDTRAVSMANFIHYLSLYFNEKVTLITEEENKRIITFQGEMDRLNEKDNTKLKTFFKSFNITSSLQLTKYNKQVVLDLITGYLIEAYFEIEVSNGGYTQNRTYTLKQENNG